MAKILALLSPFKWYLLVALLVAVSAITYRVMTWRSDAHKLADEIALNAKDVKNCKDNTTQAMESNHALTSSLNDINARYVSLLKSHQQRNACSPTGGHDGATSTNESAWELTLEQRRLNDKQAAQLISCQGVIRYIYTEYGREDLLPP